MLNNIKPNKAKSPYEMREKVLRDNGAVSKREKENEPDEFIIGLGLEQGNKRPAINKGTAAKRPEEEVFFKDEDFRYRDDDEKDEKWLNDFGKGLTEAASELGETVNNQVTQNQSRGKVANGQNGNSPDYKYDKSDPTGFMYRYNNLEDYYGTEGKSAYENAEKGMMNNLRSTLGEMGGRVAFLINDWLPNKNAQKILEENEAEIYAKMSDDYFDLARAETGKYGDKFVDFAEEFSEEAGYNLFGHKAGDIFKSADVGFKEYERLRQEGVDKELALLISAAKSGFSFAQEKLLGYGQKWIGNNFLVNNLIAETPGSKMISKINYGKENEIMEWIKQAEKETKNLSYEVCYTITPDGKVWRTVGGKSYFDISDIKSSLENSYSYHNHPDAVTNYSFSDMDLAKFVSNHEQYAKASDSLFEYFLIRTKETIEKSHDEVYHLFKEIYKTEIYQKAFDGEIDIDMDGYHETTKILCQMLNIIYERRRKE